MYTSWKMNFHSWLYLNSTDTSWKMKLSHLCELEVDRYFLNYDRQKTPNETMQPYVDSTHILTMLTSVDANNLELRLCNRL